MDCKHTTPASHLERVAFAFGDIAEGMTEGRYIGLEECVENSLYHILTAMFPYHYGKARERFSESEKRTWELMRAYDALSRTLRYVSADEDEASARATEIIDALPSVLTLLRTDVQAAYRGDPAATGTDEVILTYPAFTAISIYRVAHVLYTMNIPIVPRMMTEYAHRLTGIDIHPGATIGKAFFIDHGTGVVIGETTVIGDNVKLYQHVTLGAKSFAVGDDGTLVKGIKRHPNIGNNVVIYAGATILGGEPTIGDYAVIGGNTWIVRSVPAGTTVTM